MPRPRKARDAATGQPYGQRKAAEAMPPQRSLADVLGPLQQEARASAAARPLGAPSQRPNEPLTAGLPIGSGPGPEALPFAAPVAQPSADVLRFARYLPVLELAAASGNATAGQFVRQIRGRLPADFDPATLTGGGR